ncbi:hypothetical protein J7J47_17145 [Halomonas sp. ISL-60]|uniref:hypothetical protein n=1 Tax=Halomonas sp. ISL-56 TaxID=2819149 RepID=UPI001BE9FDE5|nr:hypothetical protein [Halomonas sp. ISL-56]MBT2773951.1 hypothetical protein [Halomonas sp. ISL-60]MBT2799898.1 hypothetical protein [Halomonas sp. ISL-56]
MKADSRSKAIHYKRVQLTHCKLTLQELLEDVFKTGGTVAKAKSRLESISQDDEVFRLVNHYTKKNKMFFGQLVVFEKGRSQAFLTIDDNSEYFSIDASNLGDKDTSSDSSGGKSEGSSSLESKINRRKEFIDSMLYFGVKNNHLVLIQSAALKARDLEAHLKWIFDGHSDSFSSSTALIFQDKPSPDVVKRLESSPAKSIFIGAPIETGEGKLVDEASHIPAGEKGIVVSTTNKVRYVPKGLGADLVKSLIDQYWFNNQDLSEALDEANLKVSLEITYLRKTTKQGHKLLDNMATALRHQHEDDVKILLDGGGEITGKDLKLSGKLSVKFFNGIIDETDLFEKMTVWLKEKISLEEVDSDFIAKPKDSGDAEA